MQGLGPELRRLKREDPEKLGKILSELSEEEAHAIVYDPDIWLNPEQVVQDWWPEPIIMFMCGRGAGKTFLGCQWLRKKIKKGVKGQIALISPTASEVRDTVILNTLIPLSDPESEGPQYEPSKSRVVWKDGTVAKMFSAEHGEERIRGSNNELIWIDELGSIPNKDVFDQAMLTLRVGESRCLITTTPRPTETIVDLYRRAVFNDDPPQEGKDVRIISFPTYNNFDNLSDAFKNTIIQAYEGTRLARQELEGKLLLDAEGALWTTEIIANQTLQRGQKVPKLERVGIGVDPAVSTGKHSDKTGIVVCGLGEDGFGYVLEDHTGKYSSEGWASKVIELYDHYRQFAPTSIAVERNQGGDFVAETLYRVRPLLPVDPVFSSSSKISRAQPIALLYEQGRFFHAKSFIELEQEMTGYEGKSREKSPDHMDAMVFAANIVMPTKNRVTKSFEMMM